MTPDRVVLVAVVVLACGGAGVATVAGGVDGHSVAGSESMATSTAGGNATLVEAYPNPVARGDPGEFVTIRFDEATNATGWTLTDGKTTARLPNRTFEDVVAFSMTPEDARAHTDHPVVELDGRLLLADEGERLELRRNGETVDTARYRTAPQSEIRDFEAGIWRPVGATDLDPIRTGGGETTAFVLPDAPDETVEILQRAESRLLLSGYTLTSERVADALLSAHDRGVDVRVLLDGSPVGGMSERQARLLDRLTEAGVEVSLLAGPHTRYRHHHPKYAVVDDRALVVTENFKPAGTGGMSSRGWGAVVADQRLADELATLHRTDRTWRAATPWETYREGRTFTDPDPALGSFEPRHPTERLDVDGATLLVAPDNADDALVAKLDDADDRVLVQQVTIDSRDNRLLQAAIRAADRGVDVRIHLADAWYVEDDNAALVEWLNRRAETEGWTLQARVDDADGYEKIHTKGVVVDDTAVVGSLNWGRASKTDNREVVVALDGEEIAGYYADVFEADWYSEGERRSLSAGLVGAVAVAVAGALLVVRKLEFVGRDGVVTDWQW